MNTIFISYSHGDRPRICALVDALQNSGHDVWWDREIPVGFTYNEHIKLKLAEAQAVIVAWSPLSVASEYVCWEALKARERMIFVPVMIEPAEIPPDFFRVQAADLTEWNGDTSHPEWKRLVGALARLGIAGESGGMPEQAPPPPRRIRRTRMPSVTDLKQPMPEPSDETDTSSSP